MSRYILKIRDHYCEWSTVVDAPVTLFMPLDSFRDYYRREYGESRMVELIERLKRADATGCSSEIGETAESLCAFNRAGPRETSLSESGLWRKYKPRPPRAKG